MLNQVKREPYGILLLLCNYNYYDNEMLYWQSVCMFQNWLCGLIVMCECPEKMVLLVV